MFQKDIYNQTDEKPEEREKTNSWNFNLYKYCIIFTKEENYWNF